MKEGIYIPRSVKNLLVIVSVKTLRLFSFIYKVIRFFTYTLLYRPIRWLLSKIWHGIILNLYQGYLSLKRLFGKLLLRHNNKLAILINNKLIVPVLIVVLASSVVTNNLAAKESNREDFGRDSLLFSMTQDEFGGHEVIEDNRPVQINSPEETPSANLKGLALSAGSDTATETPKEALNISQAGGALIQQNFLAADQARTRTEVESYTVEPGDTASSIAQKYGLSVSTILWANGLAANSLIRPGDNLKIPPEDGVIYKVAKGDTVQKISEKYQADEIGMIEANPDIDPNALAVGTEIFIPGGVPPAPKIVPRTESPAVAVRNIFTPTPPAATDLQIEDKLLWPAQSHRINQYYSWRHRGIDIDGDTGDPAYAAESGKVIYAGWSTGYGYNIRINHGNGIVTLSGHFSKLLVEEGDSVERGDVIALIGSTGWSTGAHIHFEVRVNGTQVNPLTYTK